MKKGIFYLFLASIMTLSVSLPVAAAVNKIPWMIFTYGIPGAALLAIIIPFVLHLMNGGRG